MVLVKPVIAFIKAGLRRTFYHNWKLFSLHGPIQPLCQ
jgi:hypothetical protein